MSRRPKKKWVKSIQKRISAKILPQGVYYQDLYWNSYLEKFNPDSVLRRKQVGDGKD